MKLKNFLIAFLLLVASGQAYYITNLKAEIVAENAQEFSNMHTTQNKAGIMVSPSEDKISSTTTDTITGTTLINADTALILRNMYKNHPDRIETKDGIGTDTLEGFILKKANIASLWNQSTYMYVALGIKPDDRLKPQSQQNFTIFIYGLDSNLGYIKNRNKPIVYEYVAKCPDNCPF